MSKKISTKQKGDSFEVLVFDKLKSLIENQNIPGVSKYNDIFLHKQYPSKTAPNVMLNPDITIEVYGTAEKKTWSNLLVFECKNHNRKIDNSIYREFVGNLSDYPRSGVRGIMISSVGFTQQVITLAKSDNIGLVVVSEECDWGTIVWRQINNIEQNQFRHKVIIGETSTNYPIVCLRNQFITIYDLLQQFGLPMSKALYIPYMSDDEIREKVNEILKNTSHLTNENFLKCCISVIASDYKLIFTDMQEDCLGKCDFKNHIIAINSNLSQHRQNFTIAHELGHILLHSRIIESLYSIEERESDKDAIINESIHERMEYQANIFASFLLMPDIPFFTEVNKLFKEYRINTGQLYHDNQLCNKRDCTMIVGTLSELFNVSREAVIVRMKKAKLYKEGDGCSLIKEKIHACL